MELLTKNKMYELLDHLSDRDKEILAMLKQHTYLQTSQIRRLVFTGFKNQTSATRTTCSVLRRLKGYGLIDHFKQRIGGVRAGSSALVWHLTESGERFVSLNKGEALPRKRHMEPSAIHMNHTLAISECYAQLVELTHSHENLTISELQREPECWRSYMFGGKEIQLKPDLFISTRLGEYEDRWFIEIDLSTESLPVIVSKCDRYQDYFATGKEQKNFGVFPVTLWIVPNQDRKRKITEAIKQNLRRNKLFFVITPDEFSDTIMNGVASERLV